MYIDQFGLLLLTFNSLSILNAGSYALLLWECVCWNSYFIYTLVLYVNNIKVDTKCEGYMKLSRMW